MNEVEAGNEVEARNEVEVELNQTKLNWAVTQLQSNLEYSCFVKFGTFEAGVLKIGEKRMLIHHICKANKIKCQKKMDQQILIFVFRHKNTFFVPHIYMS